MNKIPKRETLKVEFKRTKGKERLKDEKVYEAAVAMANTKGGSIYIGVDDNGNPSGASGDFLKPYYTIGLINANTVPPITPETSVINVGEEQIIKVDIPKSDTIAATKKGRILKRVLNSKGEPQNEPYYPHEFLSKLSSELRYDPSAQTVNGATLFDFDPTEISRLKNLIQASEESNYLSGLDDLKVFSALDLIKTVNGVPIPTVAGLLLLGKEESLKKFIPGSKATFQVLEGSSVIINNDYQKPILNLLEEFDRSLMPWNPETEIEDGLLRIGVREFWYPSFREGIINALCHRDYLIDDRVILRVDDEGLTIRSPGGFIEGIELNNLISADPLGRNRVLAETLKKIGLVERTGRGINRIFEGSIMYGRPLPDYSNSNDKKVSLFIPRAKPNAAFYKMLSEDKKKSGKNHSITSLLILATLLERHRATAKEIRESIGRVNQLSSSTVKTALGRLIEAGLVETDKASIPINYILSSKVYIHQGEPLEYLRQIKGGKSEEKKLIIQLAKERGSIKSQEIQDATERGRNYIASLLKELLDEGLLIKKGAGRATSYSVPSEDDSRTI